MATSKKPSAIVRNFPETEWSVKLAVEKKSVKLAVEKNQHNLQVNVPQFEKIFPYGHAILCYRFVTEVFRCSHRAKKFENLSVKLAKNGRENISSVKVGCTYSVHYRI